MMSFTAGAKTNLDNWGTVHKLIEMLLSKPAVQINGKMFQQDSITLVQLKMKTARSGAPEIMQELLRLHSLRSEVHYGAESHREPVLHVL